MILTGGSRSSAKKKKEVKGKGGEERAAGGLPGSADAGLLPGFGPRVRPSGWPFSLSFFFCSVTFSNFCFSFSFISLAN
jgi:hypothetical protein